MCKMYKIIAYLCTTWLINSAFAANDKCPPAELMNPCRCFDHNQAFGRYVVCDGPEPFNLGQYFQHLSQHYNGSKSFASITISYPELTEIPARAFSDIQFTKIELRGSDKLKTIHPDAFVGNAVSDLYISGHFNNDLVQRNNLFAAVRGATGLSRVAIAPQHAISLTKGAFRDHPTLTVIEIVDPEPTSKYTDCQIDNIAPYAFANITQLARITLSACAIYSYKLDKHAFDVALEPTDKLLYLDVSHNHISNDNLLRDVFNGINRPVELNLKGNGLRYLSSGLYEPFLKQNPYNSIDSDTECLDKYNDWLRNSYSKQWFDVNC